MSMQCDSLPLVNCPSRLRQVEARSRDAHWQQENRRSDKLSATNDLDFPQTTEIFFTSITFDDKRPC